MPYRVRWRHGCYYAMKYSQICKSIILLATILICVPCSYGQREKNNIYLFDCTHSMISNGLWEPAKSALDATISAQTSICGSQFYVIPFGDKPYEVISFDSNNYNDFKRTIDNSLDKWIRTSKYTRISDALQVAFSKIDTKKENKIYLLTDGNPNGEDSPKKVADIITNWCSNHRNCRLFYVALVNGVINHEIKAAIDACPDAFIVQCEGKVIPQIADISVNELYTNLEELSSPKEVFFSLPGKYGLQVESSDSLFDVRIRDNMAIAGKIQIIINVKNGLDAMQLHQKLQGLDHVFTIHLQCSDKRYFIANPDVTIHISDEVPAKLTIAKSLEELETSGVKWHESFLWSNASSDQKVTWDLTPVFKNELQNSRLCLKFCIADGQTEDFKAWYNGKPISNGSIIEIVPGNSASIDVQFNHNATTGKRYFSLIPMTIDGLNIINDQPSDNYEGTSLRTDYDVVWNPLKTFLLWLAIILIAILALWFCLLKRVFFPAIKMSKVLITGPGTYFISSKIRGARKVILTSRRKSQNIFSRIFTGKIKFVRADHFTPEIYIIPSGRKKKVKLRSDGKPNDSWDIYPSSIFGQYDKGILTNRASNEKSEIEFS